MLKRILTAIVAIPIAFFLIRAGGWIFNAGVLVLALAAWMEFRNMMLSKGYHLYYLTSCLAVVALIIAAGVGSGALEIPVMTFSIIGIMLEGLYYHRRGMWAPEVALSSCAVLYVGLLFSHIILLRNISDKLVAGFFASSLPMGEAFLWVALFGTWASDTFAYFIGSAFGKRKLLSAVSPKKSVEGAIAGFVGCALIVTCLTVQWLHFSWLPALGWAVLVGFAAPLGDLVESLMKRSFAIKDSGNFFPGHGGVLDRFDSILFVIPLSYYYIKYLLL